MANIKTQIDVIIIGGSYAGLSAAMALGRALRTVLVIDSAKPCNRSTPHSHNFLTHDGATPAQITTLAKRQVVKYKTIQFHKGIAIRGKKTKAGFEISTAAGETFIAKKIIFATGVKDIMPDIKGFAACWGKSVIHCPYCHGYEYHSKKTGILANGDFAYEFGKMIHNWTKDLTIFTNGNSTLSKDQTKQLKKNKIQIIETEVASLEHTNGQLKQLVLKDKSVIKLHAIYGKPKFEQHCAIPKQLGCEITELNYIKVDALQKTTIDGIYACGDNSTMMRTVSYAVAMGGLAGVMASRELIDETFLK